MGVLNEKGCKSFKSTDINNYVSKIKPAKIFRLKRPKAIIIMDEVIRPPIFGHLSGHL